MHYILYSYNIYATEKKMLLRKSLEGENTFMVLCLFVEKNLCYKWAHAVQPVLFKGQL